MKANFLYMILIIKFVLIKVQELTNIIQIGKTKSRFLNFVTFSNGTMVLEVSSDPGDSSRSFFGLNSDGNYLFEKDNNGIYQVTKSVENQVGNTNSMRQYAENFCINLTENGKIKEYIVSIANGEQYAELYDFENNMIYQKKTSELLGNSLVGFSHSSAIFKKNDNLNYIVLLSWLSNNDIKNFNTKIMSFTSKNLDYDIIKNIDIDISEESSYSTSCIVSESKYIWNMGFRKENEMVAYYIKVYKPDFNEIEGEVFNASPFYSPTFFKIIHLREDIGVAFFYSYPYEGQNKAFPSLIIRHIVDDKVTNYLINTGLDKIVINLDYREFSYDYSLNDLIKISDYKASFSTMSLDKKILFINILEIYSASEMIIKYYEIKIFEKYNIRFFLDIRQELFGQNIAFGFNYCNNEDCQKNTDTHYSAFLIFGYANSSNVDFNINQYLEQNPGKTINDLTFDLTKNIKIENNIRKRIIKK